jgi:tetratricopeptide (TPR) repeat protein
MVARALKIPLLLAAMIWACGAAGASGYLDDAKQLIAKGDLRAARIQLKNAIQSEPKNMEAHYRLGSVNLDLGDAAGAIAEATIARDGGYDPDSSIALLARADLAAGKYRQVLDEFPPGEGSVARQTEILVARGYAQLALNNPDDAKKAFEEAQRLSPQAAAPLLAEARLISQREPDAAAALFDRALALAPQSLEALVGKANLLRAKGDQQGALDLLNKAVEKNPQSLPVRLERSQI